jgi:activator of 2-hydroxyglutaryl-CoA dehydratase
MSLTAGIDIGSITAKAAILRDGAFLGTKVIFTDCNGEGAGRLVFEDLLEELGLAPAEVGRIVARPGRRGHQRGEPRAGVEKCMKI